MTLRWFEFTHWQNSPMDFFPGTDTFIDDTPLSGGVIQPGDTLLRTLVWSWWTTETADVITVQDAQPPQFTWSVSLLPTPDGEAPIPLGEIGGDALWAEPVRWRPVFHTIGSTDEVRFVSEDNGQVRDSRGQRIVPFDGILRLQGHITNAGPFDSGAYASMPFRGWIRARILFNNRTF